MKVELGKLQLPLPGEYCQSVSSALLKDHMRMGSTGLPQANCPIQKLCPSGARGNALAQETP